jgi:hypothetical protein
VSRFFSLLFSSILSRLFSYLFSCVLNEMIKARFRIKLNHFSCLVSWVVRLFYLSLVFNLAQLGSKITSLWSKNQNKEFSHIFHEDWRLEPLWYKNQPSIFYWRVLLISKEILSKLQPLLLTKHHLKTKWEISWKAYLIQPNCKWMLQVDVAVAFGVD